VKRHLHDAVSDPVAEGVSPAAKAFRQPQLLPGMLLQEFRQRPAEMHPGCFPDLPFGRTGVITKVLKNLGCVFDSPIAIIGS